MIACFILHHHSFIANQSKSGKIAWMRWVSTATFGIDREPNTLSALPKKTRIAVWWSPTSWYTSGHPVGCQILRNLWFLKFYKQLHLSLEKKKIFIVLRTISTENHAQNKKLKSHSTFSLYSALTQHGFRKRSSNTVLTATMFIKKYGQLFQQMFAFVVALFFLFEAISDFMKNGFGTSNMRVVSFIDSLWHCYNFRTRKVDYLTDEAATSPDKVPRRVRAGSTFVYTSRHKTIFAAFSMLARAFFIKFFGGTVISFVLDQDPVWKKGIRHSASFFVAFTLMQGIPEHLSLRIIYSVAFDTSKWLVDVIRTSKILQSIIRCCGALYKIRKISFIIVVCFTREHSLLLLVALAVLACECSSIMMVADAMAEGHHSFLNSVAVALFKSRWRISTFATGFLVCDYAMYGPEFFAAGEKWQWKSPLKWTAFVLLVIRNFGGIRSVRGYPLLSKLYQVLIEGVVLNPTNSKRGRKLVTTVRNIIICQSTARQAKCSPSNEISRKRTTKKFMWFMT